MHRGSLVDLRQDLQVGRARKYFQERPEEFKQMALIVNRQKEAPISLRALEYFCSDYAKKKNVFTLNAQGEWVQAQRAHENAVATHRKKALDAFRRVGRDEKKKKFNFCLHEQTIETTTAQLNFFYSLCSNGLLTYASEHAVEITEAMSSRNDEGGFDSD